MLAAKKFGKPLKPIFDHAAVHGTIAGLLVWVNTGDFIKGVLALSIMTLSHFGIDVLKGKMNVWYPSLQNPANVFHWWVFGGDQTLHILILVALSLF